MNLAWNTNVPFPTSALGRVLGAGVLQHHGNSRLPIELIAPIALGLAAAAAQDLCDVARPNLAPSPISLFVAVVASTGEGKDAAAAPWLRPFLEFQSVADGEHQERIRAFEVELQAWTVAEKVILEKLEELVRENRDLDTAKGLLLAHRSARPEPPRSPLVIYDDTTVSAIKNALCERWRSGTFFNMDAGDFFNGRLGVAYPFFNTGWGGQPIFSDRVVEGRRSVHDPRVGMIVAIQPEPFRKFLKRRGVEAHDSGFTARCMLAVPPSTKGQRLLGSWQVNTDAIDASAFRIRELLDACKANTMAGRGREVLRFAPSAAVMFVDIYNRLQMLMAPGQPYAQITGQAAKAAENVARVAAVLHIFDGLEGDINEDTLSRAAVIVEWFVNQFLLAFSDEGARPTVEQDGISVEQALWHARNCGNSSVLRSELKYWCPPEVYGTRFDRALRLLVSTNRVRLVPHKGKVYVVLSQEWGRAALAN